MTEVRGITLRNKTNPEVPGQRAELHECARRGHATYQPSGADIPAAVAATQSAIVNGSLAWRCLRCGGYFTGAPKYKCSVQLLPRIPRGQLLRQSRVLRIVAVERAIRFVLLMAATYLLVRLLRDQLAVQAALSRDLPILSNAGVNLESSAIVALIQKGAYLSGHSLMLAIILVFSYGVLEGIEAYGLWKAYRWAEYVTFVATAIFLPLEVWGLMHHPSVLKTAAFVINLAVVAYLLYAKRLFGVNGGGKAIEEIYWRDAIIKTPQPKTVVAAS